MKSFADMSERCIKLDAKAAAEDARRAALTPEKREAEEQQLKGRIQAVLKRRRLRT